MGLPAPVVNNAAGAATPSLWPARAGAEPQPATPPDASGPVGERLARRRRLAELAERIRRLQSAYRPTRGRCPSGLAELDAALGGGFVFGAVHELLASAEGAPARSLALWLAARAVETSCSAEAAIASDGTTGTAGSFRWVCYIDTAGDFYPPAAAQLGVPLDRLLIIRAPHGSDALWAAEQALRCPAVAAVVLPIRTVADRAARRLQLAAEIGGGLGFLVCRETPSGHGFAATRLRVEPLPIEATSLPGSALNAGRCRIFISHPCSCTLRGGISAALAATGDSHTTGLRSC